MAQRIRRVSSQIEMERLTDDFITMGYKVVSRGEKNICLQKKAKKDKHGLVALLTIWWTMGLGNLIYALIPASVEDEVVIKIEQI